MNMMYNKKCNCETCVGIRYNKLTLEEFKTKIQYLANTGCNCDYCIEARLLIAHKKRLDEQKLETIRAKALCAEKIYWNKQNTHHAKNIAVTNQHNIDDKGMSTFTGIFGFDGLTGVTDKVTLDGKTIWHLPNYTEFEHVPECRGQKVIAERLGNLYGGKWMFSTNTDDDYTSLEGGLIRSYSNNDRFDWLTPERCAFVGHGYGHDDYYNGKLIKGSVGLYLRLKDKPKPKMVIRPKSDKAMIFPCCECSREEARLFCCICSPQLPEYFKPKSKCRCSGKCYCYGTAF